MTTTDIALGLFACCNSLRSLAYVPQIMRIARDREGARAISYATWASSAVSHLSTVAYALLVASDPWIAVMFGADTAACLVILVLTFHKRRRTDGAGRTLAAAPRARLRCDCGPMWGHMWQFVRRVSGSAHLLFLSAGARQT